LRKFIDEYRGPNLKNIIELTESINWEAVDERMNRRVRAFGKFLQETSLPEPLTWDSIEELMPDRGKDKTQSAQMIRICLWDLAYIHVAQGTLETRERYLEGREHLNLVAQLPEHFRERVGSFVDWMKRLRYSPNTIARTIESVNVFLGWCDRRGVNGFSEVNDFVFEEYEQFLRWKLICNDCKKESPYDVYGNTPICNVCGTSMSKTRWHSNPTVGISCQHIQGLLRWGEIEGLTSHPITMKVKNSLVVRHYPDDVIKRLVQYIASPEAAPLGALVLYLIIFHACSVWELMHALLPIGKDGEVLRLSDAYHIVIQDREPSRGNLSTGRAEKRIEFDPSIVDWLQPLLQRFDEWRLQTVKNARNRFVLAILGRARHDKPVSRYFVRQAVKRGAIRAGVGDCMPKTLRLTAAVLFADSGVIGVLALMGWSGGRAYQLTWTENREIVIPRQK
jgi:hypothetical protein